MRTFFLFVAAPLILAFASSTVSVQSKNGIAGYTGSPGGFGTCANAGCHFGGSSASSGITITAVPSFTNNEYLPDSSYMMTVQIAASGFNRFGFGCEILTPAGSNAGTISANLADGVKTMLAPNSRMNATHNGPKFGSGGTSFSFPWKAPSSGSITVYAMANAINGNNTRDGDFPLAPVKLELSAAAPGTVTSVAGNEQEVILRVYPNPATVVAQLDYYLGLSSPIACSITDLKGAVVMSEVTRHVQAGHNTQSLDLRTLSPGAYFVKLSSGGKTLARKLLVVN